MLCRDKNKFWYKKYKKNHKKCIEKLCNPNNMLSSKKPIIKFANILNNNYNNVEITFKTYNRVTINLNIIIIDNSYK